MDFDQNLKKVVDFTLKKYPTFANELAKAKIYYRDFVANPLVIIENGEKHSITITSAGTDHKNIYIHKPFFEKATFENQVFILSHEIMHMKFEHKIRAANKDGSQKNPTMWNIATDYVINGNLVEDGFLMPTYKSTGIKTNKDENETPFLFREDATKYSSEELYDMLIKEQEQKNQQQSGQNQGGQGQNGEQKNQNGEQDGQNGEQDGQNRDEVNNHQLWDSEISQEEQERLDNQIGENGKTQQEENEQRQQDIQNSKEYKGQNANGVDNNEEFKDNSKFEDSLKEETINEKNFLDKNKKVKQNCNPKYGKKLTLKDMLVENGEDKVWSVGGTRKDVANWKTILKREIEKEEDMWSDRRGIAENNYAKRLEDYEEDDKPITEILIDISGSVSDDMVKNILRQTKNIFKEGDIMVGTFNLKFWGFTKIKTVKDIDNFKIPYGARGSAAWGQNMDLAVRSFSKDQKSNKLIFTDGGYVGQEMPKEDLKNKKVMWIVYGDQEFKPNCGKVIRVAENEFDKSNEGSRYF